MGCTSCSGTCFTAAAAAEPAESVARAQPTTQAPRPSSPKVGLDGAIGSHEPTTRPSLCAPEAVIGEWRTGLGIYQIALNDRMELDFTEDKLHGVLSAEDEWYIAEIRDGTEADEIYGYLRLRREGNVIRSNFKTRADNCWEDSGIIEAKPLPYLRVGARRAGEAAAETEAQGNLRRTRAPACSICFEAVDNDDNFAEPAWFSRNGSCPMRCVQPAMG